MSQNLSLQKIILCHLLTWVCCYLPCTITANKATMIDWLSILLLYVLVGLLIKQLLVSAAETSSSSSSSSERSLLDQTCGVLFYSVPHGGSSLANYSLRPTAAYLLSPSVEVRDLQAGLHSIWDVKSEVKFFSAAGRLNWCISTQLWPKDEINWQLFLIN